MGSSTPCHFSQDHIPQQQRYLKSCPGMLFPSLMEEQPRQPLQDAQSCAPRSSKHLHCWRPCQELQWPHWNPSIAALKYVQVLRSLAFLSHKKKRAEFRNELFHSLLSPAALPTSTLQSLTSTAACSRLALLNFCATVWFARFNTTSRQFQGGKGTGCL